MPEETLAVVIPAKDEAATIADVIEETRAAVADEFAEVTFVIPSSSTDGTDDIAREMGADVIPDGGTGLGEAMFRGLKRAVEHEPDFILTLDADYQFLPEEAPRLLAARHDADLVLGSRFLEDGVDYRMSWSHRFGNRILTWMVNAVTGAGITDGQTGYRLMRREVAEALRMVGRHTYVQETIIDAYRNGFSITEVPVTFAPRAAGGSRVVSSISRYGLRTFPVILHRAGLLPYLVTGPALLAAVAAPVVVAWAAMTGNVPLGVMGAVLALLGVQALFLGLYLDGDMP